MDIQKLLQQHKLWAESDGAQGTRADLSRADLSWANLSGADLSRANLSRADLSRADLGGSRIWQFGPVGSRGGWLVIKHGPQMDEVMTGCFRGTLAEFEAAVQKTHGENKWGVQYRGIIALVRDWIKAALEAPAEKA